jgi:hypothetical protein
MKDLVDRLLTGYASQEVAPPSWAYRLPDDRPLPATIPFVGSGYATSSLRMAVFASAENLAHYERAPHTVPAFLFDDRACNRHRVAHDIALASDSDDFWPTVHIGPVENGSLLCAAMFVRHALRVEPPCEGPDHLLEQLLVANVGKYSRRSEEGDPAEGIRTRNRDYAGSIKYMRPSLPLLRADLEVAQPDVVLFPKTAYGLNDVRDVVSSACPEARVLPIPQFNATVVNTHLAGRHSRALEIKAELAGTALAEWMEHLRGYAPGYAYRYLAVLEELLRQGL